MSHTSFAHILFPTDLSSESQFAFNHAVRLAVAASSTLDMVHVDEVTRWSKEFPDVESTLGAWGFKAHGHAGRFRPISIYGKEPVKPLLGHIQESLPDLMVLLTHRRHGWNRWLHREVAHQLASHAHLPTLFLPCGDEGFVSPTSGRVLLRHVLLPVDWLPDPQAGVDEVAEMARVLGCEEVHFTLLHISDRADDFPALTLPRRPGWHWREWTRRGEVVEEILETADEIHADLIVMVTEERESWFEGLHKSTVDRVLEDVRCPLLAVPGLHPV